MRHKCHTEQAIHLITQGEDDIKGSKGKKNSDLEESKLLDLAILYINIFQFIARTVSSRKFIVYFVYISFVVRHSAFKNYLEFWQNWVWATQIKKIIRMYIFKPLTNKNTGKHY